MSIPTIAKEVERFLRTGETDPFCSAWSGGRWDAFRQAHDDLREALIKETTYRASDIDEGDIDEGDLGDSLHRDPSLSRASCHLAVFPG